MSKIYDLGIFLAMLKRAAPFQNQYYQEAIATGLLACEALEVLFAELDEIAASPIPIAPLSRETAEMLEQLR